ncbi:MAG TPA: multicopper oxidase family protein [Mycobacteriales bacterium]|nr:multicopper oxidase family protein [Mycobacteriales bacterium]
MTARDAQRGVTRRGLLAATGTAALAWAATGRVERAGASDPTPAAPLPGGPLPVIPELAPDIVDGGAVWTLTEAPLPATADRAGLVEQPPLAYDGRIPGPIIRIRDGYPARVVLQNRSGEISNLHLHGLRIAPAIDRPLITVPDGGDHTYAFLQARGHAATYWYHPHLHGLVEEQMLRGLAGPLLFDPDVLPAQLAGAQEHVLLLTNQLNTSNLLVNGVPAPQLTADATRVRLRIINASTARNPTLRLRGPDGAPRPFWLVATDGGFLRSPVRATALPFGIGQRVELLVDVSPAASTLYCGEDGQTIVTLTGPDGPPLPAPAGAMAQVPKLTPTRTTHHRRIDLTQTAEGTFSIDNKLFSHTRVDQHVRYGALEVWEVRNRTSVPHPFHLHSWPFQVLSRGGRKEPFVAWRDTALVHPGETVKLAIRFDKYRGKTVYHCHIAAHEDNGMMGIVEVH